MIETARSLACGLLLLAVVPPAEAGPREPVAIIYQVSGEASRGKSAEPVRLFDRLPAGEVLELKPGARLSLAFVTGKRYELTGPARATLGPGDLAARSGDVRSLPSVPPLPHLAAISDDDDPGSKSGAIRIRGGKIGDALQQAEAVVPAGDAAQQDSEARERLRKAVESLGDTDVWALLAAVDHEDAREDAVVVEKVTPQSPGEAAGLRPGDVILSWSCAAAPPALPQPGGDAVRFPYDLLTPEIEEAPRRPVVLLGKRGDQVMTWRLAAGEWGIETRPVHPDKFPLWVLERRAKELAAAGKWPEADAAYEAALDALGREPAEHSATAWIFHRWGRTFEQRGAWDAAVERYQKALVLEREISPKSLAEAGTLNALGVTAAKRSDYPTAEKFLLQALAIREELAPGTAEITSSLNNLGTLAKARGDLEAAEKYLLRGEELQRKLAPESSDHALLFQNLGNLAGTLGELERAETYHRQALAIFGKIDPEGNGVVDCLENLANILMRKGDLAAADEMLRRSLRIRERADDEASLTTVLVSLGNLAYWRGDLEDSEAQYRRALGIQEKLDPDGLGVAMCLGNLGGVKSRQGDFATARIYLQRSLALRKKVAPESPDVAADLERLGRLEMDRGGDLAEAERLLRQALAIYDQKAPASLEASETLLDLAELSTRCGRRTAAIAFSQKALDLEHRLAPGSTGEAAALHVLGLAERQAGRSGDGTRDLCRAIDVLDRQRTRLGGTPEAKTAFEATLGDYYHACLEGLVGTGRTDEAFHALERSRARTFLALLSERDLLLSELPPELVTARRRVDAAYDQVQSELARLSAGRDDAEIERLTDELRDLRAHQEEIRTRIRRESPRSAALQAPQPLDLDGARTALDPGTVLLEYAVGREGTRLFVVQPAGAAGAGMSVFRVAAGEKALRKEVEAFRRLLERPGSDRAALQTRARRLYRLLVRPAESRIAGARRVLVSPDGPLHTLPFAALMRGDRYLVEWKPVHSILSATVYAELTRSRPARRSAGEEPLVAFGDPVYPATARDAPADPAVREALRRGLTLTPLPFTRKEVEAIAALFPQGREYLGREATEEKAKTLGPDARLIHFACHGLLDERFPLNSALALTLPDHPAEGQDNGLLQAWEIFENLRLDADLVTLSACDTALGKEMGGEGLVGLTRAFQYAGARSVLASLWGVADYSTAGFMKSFYGHLRGGETKDEALRSAQIEQIRKKSGSSHPFFWAGFELTGDWR